MNRLLEYSLERMLENAIRNSPLSLGAGLCCQSQWLQEFKAQTASPRGQQTPQTQTSIKSYKL